MYHREVFHVRFIGTNLTSARMWNTVSQLLNIFNYIMLMNWLAFHHYNQVWSVIICGKKIGNKRKCISYDAISLQGNALHVHSSRERFKEQEWKQRRTSKDWSTHLQDDAEGNVFDVTFCSV